MIRPVLLAALLVCSLGASVAVAHPAAADGSTESTILDRSDDSEQDTTDDEQAGSSDGTESTPDDRHAGDDDDDRWYDRWRSHRENRSDDRRADRDDGDGANATDDDDGDGNSTADDESDGRDDANDSDGDADRSAREDRDDRDDREENWTLMTPRVRQVIGESSTWATDRADDVDGHTDSEDGPLSELVQGLENGDRTAEPDDRADEGTTADADRTRRTDDRPTAPGANGSAPGDESEMEGDPWTDGSSTGDGVDDSGDDGEVPEPPSGPGAGAALLVTVGYLGGSRVLVTQANLLAAPAPESTLPTLRRVVEERLAGLSDVVLPVVVGYSRRDGSDPLENETRAAIYDLVRESPGIYHARLAEETGVAVETVRYHSRILDEEGLVEARKLRGRRRLYPVTMEDWDPEVAAAIADSAAADVLGAIDRLEPTTLSAVADAVDRAPSTVAHHLDRLEEDGLVTRERDGGSVRLRLRRSTRSALQGRVADD